MPRKSTPDEIRARFDSSVERFADLEIGQTSTVDSTFVMRLVAEVAAAANHKATHVLDIGCGAGNYTLSLLRYLPALNVTLVDLSRPMLNRAVDRIQQATSGNVTAVQADIRDWPAGREQFDIVLAAAVLHHLRGDEEWRSVFAKLHAALKPGGGLWVFDLVESSLPAVEGVMKDRYGAYLTELKDAEYRRQVFDYIAEEDSPRSVVWQLDLLRETGFSPVEILHKNICFAAFGGMKTAG